MKKRKTGLRRLIQRAGMKKGLLFGALLLVVCSASVESVARFVDYKILIELAADAATPSLFFIQTVSDWWRCIIGEIAAYIPSLLGIEAGLLADMAVDIRAWP